MGCCARVRTSGASRETNQKVANDPRKRVKRAVANMSAEAARRIAEGDPSEIAIATSDALNDEEVERLRQLVHRLCKKRVRRARTRVG